VISLISFPIIPNPGLLPGNQAKRVALAVFCLFFLLGSLLINCARHKKVTRVPRISEYEKNEQVFRTNEEAVKAGIYEEFVDSMLLKGVAPDTIEQKAEETPAQVTAPEELPADIMMGFRVQIGAFSQQQGAEEIASRARVRLGSTIPVYVRYYAPLWKVQVGDCRTRQEAETLRDTLRKIDYPDAWIVSSGIKR
jgi:cell division septation protein DedD